MEQIMKKLLVTLVLAGLLSGCNSWKDQPDPHFADDPGVPNTVSGAVADESSGDIAAVPVDVDSEQDTLSEQEVVQKAYEGNLAEVQLAQLAQQKSSGQEVQSLATLIEQDHQKANEKLTQMAPDLNVTLQDELKPEHKQLEERLSALSGEEFEREYVQSQID
jgi:putative membrane protein